MIRLLAALCCLALVGCVDSPVPLESGKKVVDPRLTGLWKTDLDGDPMLATIRTDTNGALVAEMRAYTEPGPEAATTRYEIVLARFGEHRYMSIKDSTMSSHWAIARYVFEGKDRWCLHPVPTEMLATDLEKKALPGAIKPDRHLPTVALSATPDQLRKYFADHGAKVFDDHPLMAFARTTSTVLPPPQTQEDRDRGEPGFAPVTPCRP